MSTTRAMGSRTTRAELERERRRAYEDRERRTLAGWSDERFRALVVAVEAGHHNEIEGHETNVGLAEVFELPFIADEAVRRGWAPPVIGPPLRRPRSP